MTGTAVQVHEPAPVATVLTNEQLQYIAGTEFVPPGLRGNLPAILACVATGRALGIADMTALRSIHIIDGKATFSAELMVQLVRRAGHSITGEVTGDAATVTGRRVDNGDAMTMTWTLAMAERAGLLNKGNWKKYPEAMLWARAVSQLCRMLFADCFAGTTYTAEELEDVGDAAEPTVTPGEDLKVGTGQTGAAELDDGLFPPRDVEEGLTSGQVKRLNMLVGQLRTAGHLGTEHLWRSCGYEPELSEDGELHWSPLRDRLTKAEGISLIDRLTKLEEAVARNPFEVAPPTAEDGRPTAEITSLTKLALAYAKERGTEDTVADAIDKHRQANDPAVHIEWLKKVIEKAKETTPEPVQPSFEIPESARA